MWIIWDEQLIDLTCHSHIFSISGNPFFRISWVSGLFRGIVFRGFTCDLGDSFGVKFSHQG